MFAKRSFILQKHNPLLQEMGRGEAHIHLLIHLPASNKKAVVNRLFVQPRS